MRLTMERLVEQLKEFEPQWNGKENDLISISSVCFFTKETMFNNNEILYVGCASNLSQSFPFETLTPIVCIEDVPVPKQYQALKNSLLIPAKADLNAVHDAIISLFKEDAIVKEFMETLYRSSLQNDDIQMICDLAKDFLHNPIVVLDNSLKHIVESSAAVFKDIIWVEQRNNGSYISEDSIQLIVEQSGYNKDHYSTSPIILPKGKLKYRRIICYIFLNTKPIGTIVIFESQRKFQKLDLKLVERLSEMLAFKMKNNEFLLYSKGAAYEHLFKDLLDDTISSTMLQERIKAHHLDIGEDIYVLAIDISKFDRTYKTLQYFRSRLDNIIENGKSILYNNYIVIVVMRKGGGFLTSQEIEKMNNFCKGKNISAGASRCFYNISMMKAHFEQAITALRLNYSLNKEYRLASYAEFTTEHLIDIATEKTDLMQFCDESLLKLLEYDTLNHTDFADCLHEFLLQERNLAHTSQALHIHRNTLIYRVNKIQEILNHDLNDGNYRFNLMISFKILEQLKDMNISK